MAALLFGRGQCPSKARWDNEEPLAHDCCRSSGGLLRSSLLTVIVLVRWTNLHTQGGRVYCVQENFSPELYYLPLPSSASRALLIYDARS
ncbi:jg27187 [Pararge aegeria aegeria]|uniref:Jg27187 protein n=1 Tax=Pararge aegeria aegeria TaxID=348720 RepID=A0A8S4SK67_9NEOP|nr:jg27187 [Pararge aegeria aegeria]